MGICGFHQNQRDPQSKACVPKSDSLPAGSLCWDPVQGPRRSCFPSAPEPIRFTSQCYYAAPLGVDSARGREHSKSTPLRCPDMAGHGAKHESGKKQLEAKEINALPIAMLMPSHGQKPFLGWWNLKKTLAPRKVGKRGHQ